jgi:hypothetical protein
VSRTIPHAPFPPAKVSIEDATRWQLVRLHPRPEARAAGMRAYDADAPRSENPYALLTPEGASWDAGWHQRCEEEF